jgi:hypothetical protein
MTLTLADPAFLGAGVPSVPWTPAQRGANLRLWLDADDASTISLNGSRVSQWRDKSGLSNHMNQATAINQPLYQLASVNGRASVVSDPPSGGWRVMRTAVTPLVNFNGAGMSSMVVGRTDTDLNNGLSRFVIDSNNQRLFIGTWIFSAAGPFQSGSTCFVYGTSGNTQRETHPTRWEDTLRIAGSTITSGGSGITYVDGIAGPTLSFSFANFSARLELDHGTGSQAWRGPMCEVVLMVNVLGTSDREKLEGYLAHKWQGAGAANNLPSGHPFKSVPPTV